MAGTAAETVPARLTDDVDVGTRLRAYLRPEQGVVVDEEDPKA